MDSEVELEQFEKLAGFRIAPKKARPIRKLCGDVVDCEKYFMTTDQAILFYFFYFIFSIFLYFLFLFYFLK